MKNHCSDCEFMEDKGGARLCNNDSLPMSNYVYFMRLCTDFNMLGDCPGFSPKETEEAPQSIDVWTRNRTVAKTLTDMGLVVIPHFDRVGGPDYLIVSTGIPHSYLERRRENWIH